MSESSGSGSISEFIFGSPETIFGASDSVPQSTGGYCQKFNWLLCGLLILIFVIFVLYWCGYFDSTPTTTMARTQKMSNIPKGQLVDLHGDLFQNMLQNGQPFVVAFVSNSCGHCTNMKPHLAKAAQVSKIPLFTLHADQANMDIFQKYDVNALPTMIKFVNGSPQQVTQGAQSLDKIVQFCS